MDSDRNGIPTGRLRLRFDTSQVTNVKIADFGLKRTTDELNSGDIGP